MINDSKLIKRRRNWLRSQMDCGEDYCGECRVCRRMDFLEWVGQVAHGVPHSVERDDFVDAAIRARGQT